MMNVLLNFGVASLLTFVFIFSGSYSSASNKQNTPPTPTKTHPESTIKALVPRGLSSLTSYGISNKLYEQTGSIVLPYLSDNFPQFPAANGSRYFRYDENNALIYVDKNDLTKAPKRLTYPKQLTALIDSPSGRYTLAIPKTADGFDFRKTFDIIDAESMVVTEVNDELIQTLSISVSNIRFSSDDKKFVIVDSKGAAIFDLKTKKLTAIESLPWKFYDNRQPILGEPRHCFNSDSEPCKAFDIRFSKSNSQIEFVGAAKDEIGEAIRFAKWSVTTGKIHETRIVKTGKIKYGFSVQFASDNTAITYGFCADPCPIDSLENSFLDLISGDPLLSSRYSISYNKVTDLLFVIEGVFAKYTYKALNRSDLKEVWSITYGELAKTDYSSVSCQSDWIPFKLGMVCTTGLVPPPSGLQFYVIENAKVSNYGGATWHRSIMQKNSTEFASLSIGFNAQTISLDFFKFKLPDGA
ncbi:MAG: hypothetical protein ACXVBQ_13215 [Pseudobdellovibrionaceae bacterium]